MYQDIDDIDAEDGLETNPKRRKLAGWVIVAGLLLAALALFAYLTQDRPAPAKTDLSQKEAASQAYRIAISEQDPALRRARLSDYLLTIENGPHEAAVLAQIDVINQYEGADWEHVQLTAYNPRLSTDDKLAALSRYEEKWGGSLLGGREDDIERLKLEIIQGNASDTLPDRSLDGVDSPIDQSVPDDYLAGGPGFGEPGFPRYPANGFPSLTEVSKIVPLRVKRNREPDYPRRAERRGIEAVVTLMLNVDDEGRVVRTEVANVEADRYEDDFVRASERAAMRTRFYPRTENGRPVPVSGVIKRYRFEVN